MSKKETILLNGQKYDVENIEKIHSETTVWQKEIYSFLKNWFANSDVITVHTSGSTGVPKEIHLTKEMMRNSARMTNRFFGLDSSQTALLCLPASYIAGKMMLVRAVVGGFNLITVEPKANPFIGIKEKIDFAAITPYQLSHSLESLRNIELKNIIVGGAPISGTMEAQISQISAAVYETYGMTETASHIALRRINGKCKSDFFTPLDDVHIRQDKRGCLVINAPYLSPNEFVTNDLVELTGENSFRWLGRADSVINSGGVKIFPEQVEKKLEKILSSHFFIASVPDKKLGNRVILILESEKYSPLEEEKLFEKLKDVLQKYEIPKEIHYLPKFNYSAGNKILREKVIQQVVTRI